MAKKKYMVNLDESTQQLGVKKAKQGKRSFSAYVEYLIEKDCKEEK